MFNKCFNIQYGLVILRTKTFKCELKVLTIWIGLLRSGLGMKRSYALSKSKGKGKFFLCQLFQMV